MRRTDRTKSDRKYLKANILGFSFKIHKTGTILLSIMVFITLTGLALAKVYNMKQSQNITDKATTRKITQQETSTRKKASSTQIELPEETYTQANEEEYENESTSRESYEPQEEIAEAETDATLCPECGEINKAGHYENKHVNQDANLETRGMPKTVPFADNPAWLGDCIRKNHDCGWSPGVHGHTATPFCLTCNKTGETVDDPNSYPCAMGTHPTPDYLNENQRKDLE